MTPLIRDEFRVRWADPLRFDSREAALAVGLVRSFAVGAIDRRAGKRHAFIYSVITGHAAAVWWTAARVIVVEFYVEPKP